MTWQFCLLKNSLTPQYHFRGLILFCSLWNRDFSDALDIYPHKAVNQLESTFLALTNYELYVSEALYDNYYEKIIKRTDKKKNKDKSTKDPSSDDGEEEEY